MLTSYHNHTAWSDGEGTIAEFVAAARLAGVVAVGISDHYVPLPNGGTLSWSMPLDALDGYVAEVHAVAGEYPAGAVLLGLETDYFPETITALAETLRRYPFDYIIGSVHLLDDFPIDESPDNWAPLREDERVEIARRYWRRLRAMAESKVFDIAAHLDLYKKYGWQPAADLAREITEALDALAAAGMALEINTAGWDKPAEEAYPAEAILREARRREIPLVINADAHRGQDVTAHFARARALARTAGYTELCGYRQRERFSILLEE